MAKSLAHTNKLAESISEDIPAEATLVIVDEIEKNWGNIIVSSSIRKRAAKKFGVELEKAEKWKTISDIFKELDLSEIAKAHNNEAGELNKFAATVIGCIFPVTFLFMNRISSLSNEKSGKIVELIGKPTPSHLLNIIAQRLSEKKFLTEKESCITQINNIENTLLLLNEEKSTTIATLSDETAKKDLIISQISNASRNFLVKLLKKKKLSALTEEKAKQYLLIADLTEQLSELDNQIKNLYAEKAHLEDKITFIDQQNV